MNFRNWLALPAFAALAFSVSLLHGQETAVQEKIDYKTVIANYLEATGGVDAHKGLTSVTSKGSMSIPNAGMEGKIESAQTADKALIKITLAGMGEQIVGRNGDTVWQISQMTGPEILEGDHPED